MAGARGARRLHDSGQNASRTIPTASPRTASPIGVARRWQRVRRSAPSSSLHRRRHRLLPPPVAVAGAEKVRTRCVRKIYGWGRILHRYSQWSHTLMRYMLIGRTHSHYHKSINRRTLKCASHKSTKPALRNALGTHCASYVTSRGGKVYTNSPRAHPTRKFQ